MQSIQQAMSRMVCSPPALLLIEGLEEPGFLIIVPHTCGLILPLLKSHENLMYLSQFGQRAGWLSGTDVSRLCTGQAMLKRLDAAIASASIITCKMPVPKTSLACAPQVEPDQTPTMTWSHHAAETCMDAFISATAIDGFSAAVCRDLGAGEGVRKRLSSEYYCCCSTD